jgi:c-di-GMP-binding flagellar brake protein YcgR
MSRDQRKYPRVNVNVPIFYECYDEECELFEQKIGTALDISQGGILIETDHLMDANYIKIGFVNYQNELIEITGSIIWSRKKQDRKVHTGVCFHGSQTENIKFASNLVRTYHYLRQISPGELTQQSA